MTSNLLAAIEQGFRNLAADLPSQLLSAFAASAALGLEEKLREEIEVARVHDDRRVDCHGLNLAVACREKSPDRDGVDDESPDHLGDLDDGDEGCDRLDDAGRSLEGHEEKVHVHDGVHEVVCGCEPQSRSVL
eukprot:CAMPEP_0206446848 /NCGR_PEP_ID=MMETSP0324_2-20121206/16398_1 /ASSEMBLY_ACC=CAM_ASM_000836 /TAXON_ID=2866 /ORGANISM="Crypthecodinium cohnii, Strain Seligo" /LENGTH=132 /DNA_ID=CAMNT_0053915433 /DNA_START=313 /DNA_END=708 /DNA_ORIENTATION=-